MKEPGLDLMQVKISGGKNPSLWQRKSLKCIGLVLQHKARIESAIWEITQRNPSLALQTKQSFQAKQTVEGRFTFGGFLLKLHLEDFHPKGIFFHIQAPL